MATIQPPAVMVPAMILTGKLELVPSVSISENRKEYYCDNVSHVHLRLTPLLMCCSRIAE
jgi:hypothetical protein